MDTARDAESLPIDGYAERCRYWLNGRCRPLRTDVSGWEVGSDDVSVFHNLSPDEEKALIHRAAGWQNEKLEAGYGAIDWPTALGGAGLSAAHARTFRKEEASFDTPGTHELIRITVNLVAPTIRDAGTDAQRSEFVPRFLSCEETVCQLFSEPEAGSDLAGLRTRAEAGDGEWIVNGSKVWSSGAQFADWGFLLARTDPDVPKHAGITAFLLPMSSTGLEVRPIRQMSGGSSFNEVYFDDVAVSDELRIGEVGDGWRVALRMLGYERGQSGSKRGVGGTWERVLELARWVGRVDDPIVRQRLAKLYAHERLREVTRLRFEAARERGAEPGPEGSIGKLLWTQGLTSIGELAADLLGPRMTADTGEWGTFSWNGHLLGAPGYRIAGGSDEIQKNILGERALGLPAEPRADRGAPRDGKSA